MIYVGVCVLCSPYDDLELMLDLFTVQPIDIVCII